MADSIEDRLWLRVKSFAPYISGMPFVRGIFVANSLALGKVDSESDIDLLIVMRRKGMFLGRFFVTMLLHFFGVRRHGSKVAGRFCLSFFVEEDVVDFTPLALKDDYYLAFWLVTLVAVYDPENYLETVHEQNQWVYSLVQGDIKPKDFPVIRKRFLGKMLMEKALDLLCLEGLFRWWQLGRAQRKFVKNSSPIGIILTPRMLKFHLKDRRAEFNALVLERYQGRITLKEFLDCCF